MPAARLQRRPIPVAQIGVATLAAACLLATTGCHRDAHPGVAPADLPPISVLLTTVEAGGWKATEEVPGTVRAQLRAAVEAKLAGRIETLSVSPGQKVRQGDTIAFLDAREVKARLDSAQAVREQAARDFQRTGQLVKDGAATAAELDSAQARLRVANATVAEAETMLAHARVAAPFDGVITRKLADVGDLAVPGRPLVEIEDPTRLRFEADVPEALADRIAIGASLGVRVASQSEPVSALVSEISPVAADVSRTYLVKLDLPSLPGLRAGQFGRLAVPTGDSSVTHVPAAAITQRGQLEFVFVADAGKARLRLIRTGRRLGESVEVVSGLTLGERLVAAEPDRVQDGQPLEVAP